LGFFLECLVVTLGGPARDAEARLEHYEFREPIFFSWQGKTKAPQNADEGSKIMECIARDTLLVDTRRLPRPSVSRELDPPRRIKLGLGRRDGFSFSCSFVPKRRGRFLFHLVLPDFCLPIEQRIFPSGFYPRFHEKKETLTWICEESVDAKVMFLSPDRLTYEKKRKEQERVIWVPENAQKAYRELKDWATLIADIATSTR
jgi:hypothetical protein